MKLTTDVQFPTFDGKIQYNSKVLFFGSCFSENIGASLAGLKFDACANPLGIAYNPISIARQIELALDPKKFDENKVISQNEQYLHFDFHSSFNRRSKLEYLVHAEKRIEQVSKDIRHADFVFLTLGTSVAFRLKKTNEVVNNCHKVDAKNFDKEMLDLDEMENALSDSIFAIQAANPKAKIVLTVSPVRHLRHGSTDNMRSKARLIMLCEKLAKTYENCSYLPVYELVMDELRDYRFYRTDDLIHLNDLGTSIIMERFKESLINPESYELMERIGKWKQLLGHKIQDGQSDAAKKFIKKCFDETLELSKILPKRFDNELNALQLLSQK